ncbi:MAG: elongation factor P [Planctomycetes bacterium]|nr:elongation factor P [Planctomycetota bacterium]
MARATEIRKGNVLIIDGDLWVVAEYKHHTPGNLRAIINMKCKSLSTGSWKHIRAGSSESYDVAYLEKRKAQYLYKNEGTGDYVFMDQGTYDQYELDHDLVGDQMPYVKENDEVQLTFHGEKAISLDLPPSVNLTITESEPAAKGNTVSNIFKRAVVETGLEIKVPLHIDVGELVKISTETGEFMGRAKE